MRAATYSSTGLNCNRDGAVANAATAPTTIPASSTGHRRGRRGGGFFSMLDSVVVVVRVMLLTRRGVIPPGSSFSHARRAAAARGCATPIEPASGSRQGHLREAGCATTARMTIGLDTDPAQPAGFSSEAVAMICV